MTATKSFLGATTNSSSDNHLEATFTEGVSEYLDEVERLEKTVGHDAFLAGAQCIIQPYCEKALAPNADSM